MPILQASCWRHLQHGGPHRLAGFSESQVLGGWEAGAVGTPWGRSSRHLSAMCSCRASRASRLSVFHMASVSVDISSVSRNAAALGKEEFAACQPRQKGN